MRLRGGYTPRMAGKPQGPIQSAAVPDALVIPLCQAGREYEPAVSDGDQVAFGDPLAWAAVPGGRMALPAPAAGRVQRGDDGNDDAVGITLAVEDDTIQAREPMSSAASLARMRNALAIGGVWPLIHSVQRDDVPSLDDSEGPDRLVVSLLATEPFTPDCEALLPADNAQFERGIAYLAAFLKPQGGRGLIVASQATSPRNLRRIHDLAHQSVFEVETLPARYPADHPRMLANALRKHDRTLKPSDTVWVIDLQGAMAIGACLGQGIALHDRVIAVGGPGVADPRHWRLRIGSRLSSLVDNHTLSAERFLLRGGLFTGVPLGDTAVVETSDDAIFALPNAGQREFMGFVSPGFDRVSAFPCFGSAITGGADRHVSATLRGERRPCIACGMCEKCCPVGLLPQMLHRALYRDAVDTAQSLGVDLCIDCGLCSYVCPSKIDLRQAFADARRQLHEEQTV